MPNFISVNGEWLPAKEEVGLINRSGKEKVIDGQKVPDGAPYIYRGADRAALLMLWENKVEKLGMSFTKDPQMVDMVRKFGFKDMNEYCEFAGVNVVETEKAAKEQLAVFVSRHELPKRVKEIEVMSGGTERGTGREIRKGGFGDAPDV
jgi:hypothetical protein